MVCMTGELEFDTGGPRWLLKADSNSSFATRLDFLAFYMLRMPVSV